jgi:hypothetical protein
MNCCMTAIFVRPGAAGDVQMSKPTIHLIWLCVMPWTYAIAAMVMVSKRSPCRQCAHPDSHSGRGA